MYKESRSHQSAPDIWEANFRRESEVPDFLSYAGLRLDSRWREMAKRLPRYATIVDAGCGMGQWGAFLGRNGFKVLGLDYSVELIRPVVRKYRDIPWICGQVQRIPLASRVATCVISWGVIEHDEAGPQAALREFFRILSPGGYIFVTVPYDTAAQRKSSIVQYGDSQGTGTFFQYFFSRSELADAVRDAGFIVETTIPCGGHYAILFPYLYMRVARLPAIVQQIVPLLLKPLVWLRPDSRNMVLAVARKPG